MCGEKVGRDLTPPPLVVVDHFVHVELERGSHLCGFIYVYLCIYVLSRVPGTTTLDK